VCFDLKRGRFDKEPEFLLLPRFVHPGDWVLDIGANVGYYTMYLSDLVGNDGHVFAFEPILDTSEILSSAARFLSRRNITIFNAAVSEKSELLRFMIDKSKSGLPNYFEARSSPTGTDIVFAVNIDAFEIPRRVAFVKIDTEGAERAVLRGMNTLIERDHPVLLIEGDESLQSDLSRFGYRCLARLPGSPNLLFLPQTVSD
jgi:FkbM family methyltransferase